MAQQLYPTFDVLKSVPLDDPLYAMQKSKPVPSPVPTANELRVWEDSALAFVNEQRLEANRPILADLPAGITVSACECPIAKALPVVDGRAPQANTLTVTWGDKQVDTPSSVAKFIVAFDLGRYPELVLETI